MCERQTLLITLSTLAGSWFTAIVDSIGALAPQGNLAITNTLYNPATTAAVFTIALAFLAPLAKIAVFVII